MSTTVEARRVEDESLGLQRASNGGTMDIATTRSAQEVQAAMVIAKRFPRDVTAATSRINEACKRKALAESALYSYPRGNETVTGPSIRLAETMAQCWGNMDFGIIELEQRGGESHVMAYAWDLETNTRQTKIFTVPHIRHTRSGQYKLTDPRDIYEMVANQGARRLRACILGIIPGDIQDSAVAECEKTMRGRNTEPLIDRVRKMIQAFQESFSVTQAMIERRLGHHVDTCSETELVQLRKIFSSLKDGMASREQFFEVQETDPNAGTKTKTESLTDKLKSQSPQGQSSNTSPAPAAAPSNPPAAATEQKQSDAPAVLTWEQLAEKGITAVIESDGIAVQNDRGETLRPDGQWSDKYSSWTVQPGGKEQDLLAREMAMKSLAAPAPAAAAPQQTQTPQTVPNRSRPRNTPPRA